MARAYGAPQAKLRNANMAQGSAKPAAGARAALASVSRETQHGRAEIASVSRETREVRAGIAGFTTLTKPWVALENLCKARFSIIPNVLIFHDKN